MGQSVAMPPLASAGLVIPEQEKVMARLSMAVYVCMATRADQIRLP
jgi:hypothetical protein